MEVDSESDEDIQMEELSQLTAVLEADGPEGDNCSQYSASTSLCSVSTKAQQEYSKIQSALALNCLTDEKLRKLEGILVGRLMECRQRLKEIDGTPMYLCEKPDKVFRYINCGKPYFKDRDSFPAPDNEDTKLMAKSNMYDFSTVTSVPGWTIKDKGEFISTIQKMSLDKRKHVLNSQINQIKRNSKGKDYGAKCRAIKKEISKLKKLPFADLALPIDEEYDWDAIANNMTYRHSPQEYRALWKLFLHPSITKRSWTKSEHVHLQTLAHAHDLQDWDQIAEELNTGRTGYQCFVYFRTNMSNTFTGQKWTKEEEEYLKRLIDYYREEDYIPWTKIATLIENRTKIQIYNKYFRLTDYRKGRFVPEEDAVILTCVKEFGPNFKRIMQYLPGRSLEQLRVRYSILAQVNNTKTSIIWTVDEDRKLLQFMANQDATTNYSSITKHFPGKKRSHIRGRYLTLEKWMKKYPHKDITAAPRRGARRLSHGEASQDLNKAVENLKTRIQSEVDVKRTGKIHKDSSEAAIDAAIIVTLINERIKEDEQKKSVSSVCDNEHSSLEEYPSVASTSSNNIRNLQQVLILLKAKLDRTLFKNSEYANDYAGLQANTERYVLVKSYSKKETVYLVNKDQPDIWGEKVLTTSEYVLPPNYCTITGCRKLMSYASAKCRPNDKEVDLCVLMKKHYNLKAQIHILMERFNVLFLWPMLLSNENPSTCDTKTVSYRRIKNPSSVTLPVYENKTPFDDSSDED